MPNNPLTPAELQAYSINPTGIPQMPAGYFLASPVSGTGPFAYRLFDASYISIGIINPNRLGTGSTGAGTRYLADDGTWKLVSSISLPTPTLAQVTTAGNTTSNAITVGGITAATNLFYTDTGNSRVGIGTTTPGDKLSIVDASNANIFGRITANGTNASAAWVAQNDQVDNVVYRVFGSAVTGYQMGISLARSASLMANLNGTGSFLVGTYSGTDLVLGTANNENMRISNNTGNVLINTNIDAGYLLDVNGSARVSGELTLGTDNISDAWVAYTPIWSSQGGIQPSLGDGTITGFYKKIGKTVFVRVKLNFGVTTTGGTGAWLFSLPVNAASQDGIQFPCSMLDNGFAWYQGIVNGTYSGFTDKSAIIAQSPGGANSSQGVSGAFPFGWGNGDSLQFNGSYECI